MTTPNIGSLDSSTSEEDRLIEHIWHGGYSCHDRFYRARLRKTVRRPGRNGGHRPRIMLLWSGCIQGRWMEPKHGWFTGRKSCDFFMASNNVYVQDIVMPVLLRLIWRNRRTWNMSWASYFGTVQRLKFQDRRFSHLFVPSIHMSIPGSGH